MTRLLSLLLAAGLALGAWGFQRARTWVEGAELRVQGVQVAKSESEAALTSRLSEMRQSRDAFAAELARVEEKAHGTHVIATATGSTGAVQAGGAAQGRPAPEPGDGGGTPSLPASPGQVCLLAQGDRGEIRVTGAAVRAEHGSVALAATAEAWGLNPDRLLLSGPLAVEAAYLAPEPTPAPSRGLGAYLACSSSGCGLGLSGAWQPSRHLEVVGGAAILGAFSVSASGLVRW